MGYCFTVIGSRFEIPAEHVQKACEAWEKASGEALVGEEYGAWRAVFNEKTGDITDLEMHGEKLYDEDDWFYAIAPYVKHGSYITASGEDGTLWQWQFRNGECIVADGMTFFAPKVFKDMDWALLRKLKAILNSLAMHPNYYNLREYERDALLGTMNVLDALQDDAVDSENFSEETVFGQRGIV